MQIFVFRGRLAQLGNLYFEGKIPVLRVFARLYFSGILKGGVVFHSLVVGKNNSECTPADILTTEEVEELRRQLCRLPQINKGRVGAFTWKASNEELPTVRGIAERTDQALSQSESP
ncbi:MAG: hypothetical protein ACLP9L_23830 [Thermoguttaceae bacterium]